jgi:NitT/TauT family transport system ATP-binding protein
MSEIPRIQITNLTKTFPTSREKILVLRNISFQVKAKEFVVILGPSGCGKTTLLRIIAGLTESTSGQVMVDGEPVSSPGKDRGYMFQNFSLFPWLTVRENIGFGISLRGINGKQRRERVDHYLQVFELAEFGSFHPCQLSGGMQQRVALARTLANDPNILLLDEPFGSLDALTRITIQDFVNKIVNTLDQTILLVTHDVSEAVFLADRVIVLSNRPTQVAAEVPIDLCRPRSRSETYTPHFQELVKEIFCIAEQGQLEKQS